MMTRVEKRISFDKFIHRKANSESGLDVFSVDMVDTSGQRTAQKHSRLLMCTLAPRACRSQDHGSGHIN